MIAFFALVFLFILAAPYLYIMRVRGELDAVIHVVIAGDGARQELIGPRKSRVVLDQIGKTLPIGADQGADDSQAIPNGILVFALACE